MGWHHAQFTQNIAHYNVSSFSAHIFIQSLHSILISISFHEFVFIEIESSSGINRNNNNSTQTFYYGSRTMNHPIEYAVIYFDIYKCAYNRFCHHHTNIHIINCMVNLITCGGLLECSTRSWIITAIKSLCRLYWRMTIETSGVIQAFTIRRR